MHRSLSIILGLVAATALSGCAATAQTRSESPPPAPDDAQGNLFSVVSALDTEAFDAFNHCSAPEQLEKYASYFAPDVEFYHDQGGVTWNRQDMLASTQKYVCDHFRRELVPGSLKVFPIKDFGAIAQGTHLFCQFDTGTCDGIADFVMIWHLQEGKWQITRVLSFGHRANEPAAH